MIGSSSSTPFESLPVSSKSDSMALGLIFRCIRFLPQELESTSAQDVDDTAAYPFRQPDQASRIYR